MNTVKSRPIMLRLSGRTYGGVIGDLNRELQRQNLDPGECDGRFGVGWAFAPGARETTRMPAQCEGLYWPAVYLVRGANEGFWVHFDLIEAIQPSDIQGLPRASHVGLAKFLQRVPAVLWLDASSALIDQMLWA